MKKETLFLFTKTFPYGKGEQYLEQELPVLAGAFRKIYIIPCSVFEESPIAMKNFPANAETFLINRFVRKKKFGERIRNFFELSAATIDAVFHNRDGAFFYRHLRRYRAIFRQQQACASAMAEFFSKTGTDVRAAVFYSYWTHNSCIILGLLKKRGLIPAFVTRAHSYDLYHQEFFREEEKPLLAWEWFKFKNADRVYCISEHGADFLKHRYPQWQNRFLVSRLGVEDSAVENPADTGDVFTIVTCSTIQPAKRLFLVPRILAHVPFPVKWIHFGAGDQQYIDQLMQEWNKLDQAEFSMELRGYTPNAEVRKFYSETHIDLFLNLSLAEGVPVSLMEAASYGIPLLATDVYGTSEIARAECGFLVPKHFRSEDAAAFFTRLKNDPELSAGLREGGKMVQRRYFNAEKNFRAFAEEIRAVA